MGVLRCVTQDRLTSTDHEGQHGAEMGRRIEKCYASRISRMG